LGLVTAGEVVEMVLHLSIAAILENLCDNICVSKYYTPSKFQHIIDIRMKYHASLSNCEVVVDFGGFAPQKEKL
jgi:hypothetical protein